MFRKNFILFLLATLLMVSACGRKAGLTYEGEMKRPDFTNVIEEE